MKLIGYQTLLGGKISELEDIVMETILNETEKRRQKSEWSISALWETFMYPHIYAIGVSEGVERDGKREEKMSGEIMTEYYQIPQTAKAQLTSSRRHTKKATRGR